MAKWEKKDGIIFRNNKPMLNRVSEHSSEITDKETHLTSNAVKMRVYSGISTGWSVLKIVIGLLLLIGVVQIYNHPQNPNIPTFTGLLDFLSHLEIGQLPFISSIPTELGDWGIFNWFRDFVAAISSVLNVVVFLCNGLAALVQYIAAFCQFIFT